MRLPLPDPHDAMLLLGRGPALVETALLAVPRALALIDAAESLLLRVDMLMERIEVTRFAADVVVENTSITVARANVLVESLAPSLTMLQPTLERLAETTRPEEVDAMVKLVDHLPKLVEHLETDILPMMTTLSSVGPDVHDLLGITSELSDMLGKLPGMGRIKRRVEEEQGQDLREDD